MQSLNAGAVEARVRRKLAQQDQTLKKSRSQRDLMELGTYFIVNSSNCLCAKHCELEQLAKELEVIGADQSVLEVA